MKYTTLCVNENYYFLFELFIIILSCGRNKESRGLSKKIVFQYSSCNKFEWSLDVLYNKLFSFDLIFLNFHILQNIAETKM